MSDPAEPGSRAARRAVPLVPFCVSLVLSLSTVGNTVYWQDSGFYHVAVHEFLPLYPPGFLLYLFLCKGWTLLTAPLLGFPLAVHLFSSLCAAGGAAFLALAARRFLVRVAPGPGIDVAAAAAGCLMAAGYSYAFAAILAKSYALFYFLASVLLWLLARAERRRHFLLMGVVLGASWSAHPLATMLVPVMLAYAWARRDRIRDWGWGFFALVVGLAAFTAFAPAALLPALTARTSVAQFGEARTLGEVVDYVRGARFLDQGSSHGWDALRWTSALRFGWEEFLGGGVLLLGAGVWGAFRRCRGLLALIGAWVVPVVAATCLSLHEVYPDQWLVAAWIPLGLLVALGVSELEAWRRRAGIGAAAGGLAWMLLANGADLNQRGYTAAEEFSRLVINATDPGAPLLVWTDDAISGTLYLRLVRGEGRDRRIVSGVFLGEAWYQKVVREQYGLKTPDVSDGGARMKGLSWEFFLSTAFANENAGPGRPVFTEHRPDARYLRPDLAVVPAGMFWKVMASSEAALDLRYWDFGVSLPEWIRRKGRARATRSSVSKEGVVTWRLESYEERLIQPILLARRRLATQILQAEPAKALAIYEEVLALDPALLAEPDVRYYRALALYLTDRLPEAHAQFQALLASRVGGELRTMGHYYLGELALAARRPEEARRHFQAALENGGVDPAVLEHIRRRAGGP